jgi:hypothetical protein
MNEKSLYAFGVVLVIGSAIGAAWYWFQQQALASNAADPTDPVTPNPTSDLLSSVENITVTAQKLYGTAPRGIRNNNPGNLRTILPPERPWNGQTGDDGSGYGVYATPALGVRAMSKQLQKDAASANTLSEIITSWAPPNENDTTAYIDDVSTRLGVNASAPFSLYENLPLLVPAMIQHENGEQPYAQSDIVLWVYS